MGGSLGYPYGKRDIIEELYSSSRPDAFPSHQTAEQARDAIGAWVWSRIFKFSFVRNPWDRVLSLYKFRMGRGKLPQHLGFKDYVISLANEINANPEDRKLFRYAPHRLSAYEFLADKSGNIMVDYIARYENRAQDIDVLRQKTGLSDIGIAHVQASKGSREHYSRSYDRDTRRIIEEIYANDIEAFKYCLEDAQ